jgi:hypothetical protein
LYKSLSHTIESKLPIIIQFFGNLRFGSSSLDREGLSSILNTIEDNPWAYAFLTRRLVNQYVSQSKNREKTIQSLGQLLSPLKGKLLGLMMTDDLRQNSWGRKIGSREDASEPFYPGDYLNQDSEIRGVPLMMPATVSYLKLGVTNYTLYLRDKLSNFTSLINPYHGLTRIQEVWGINADVLVGGHTESIGWRTWMRPWGQIETVVPGGFAEYTEKTVANRVDYPRGGQGVILFPNEKRIYSFASAEDGRDLHEAVWLMQGLKLLGIDGRAQKDAIPRKVKRK